MTVGMPYKRGAERQWPTVEEMKASAVTNFISLLYFLGFSGFAAIPLIKPIIKDTIERISLMQQYVYDEVMSILES